MADTVTATKVAQTSDEVVYHLTGITDGTGESDVLKVDKSGLVAPDGSEPASLTLMEIDYAVGALGHVKLSWDRDTDVTAIILPEGVGQRSFREFQGLKDTGSGGAGDVFLSTVAGKTAGEAYDILVTFRLESD